MTDECPNLDEALRDLLAKYVHAYGPNEMIAELQSVIDGIRDVQELDAQTVYTPVNTSNERTADHIGGENKSDDTDAYARWRA